MTNGDKRLVFTFYTYGDSIGSSVGSESTGHWFKLEKTLFCEHFFPRLGLKSWTN